MTTKGIGRGDGSSRRTVPQDGAQLLLDGCFSTSPDDGRAVQTKGVTATQIEQVFVAWRDCTGRSPIKTKLNEARRTKIRLALESYPVEDVLDAVRGWQMSAFHRGENREHRVWNELTLLLRNGEQIEKFRDLAQGASWLRNELGARTPRQQASDVRRRIAMGEA